MPSYTELLAQRDELDRQLEHARTEERQNVMQEIVRKMQAHKITLDEVRGEQPKHAPSRAKYRDPATGKEWTGRGKPPNWIKDAPDRDAFLIDPQ